MQCIKNDHLLKIAMFENDALNVSGLPFFSLWLLNVVGQA